MSTLGKKEVILGIYGFHVSISRGYGPWLFLSWLNTCPQPCFSDPKDRPSVSLMLSFPSWLTLVPNYLTQCWVIRSPGPLDQPSESPDLWKMLHVSCQWDNWPWTGQEVTAGTSFREPPPSTGNDVVSVCLLSVCLCLTIWTSCGCDTIKPSQSCFIAETLPGSWMLWLFPFHA